MSVLQIGKYYYPYMGGIENHLYLLCNELKNRVPLEVVVCNDRNQTVHEVVEGVRVTRCGQMTNVASTSLCPQMPLVISRRRYRVIHFHFPNPMGVMAYLTSTKPGPHKIIVTYHSDIVRQENLQKIYAPFMHRVLNQATAIICTSPDYLASSLTLARYRQKCQVIPYGIDISQFGLTPTIETRATALRQQYRGPLLLAVGRLIYYKGFEYLISAMRAIDAELLLIGDGPLRADLEKLAQECGVADRVHFLGEIHNQDLTPYYYAADLFVLPSIARSEAFAIVQLEAMACRLPVVNTALDSGVPFVSRHGESGLTVEPKNPDALAQAINELLADPVRLTKYGEAGRRRVEREFTKEVMAEKVLQIYRHCLGRGA